MSNENLTVSEVNRMIEDLKSARELLKNIKEEKDKQQRVVDTLETTLQTFLENSEMENYASPSGTVYLINDWSVPHPQDVEREKFYNYLKEKKLFESMVTVNSQTLKSFYKTELENARERGEFEFEIPGIKATSFKRMGFRKA